ncbi:hypothetical protein ABFA07_017958 [Porites harrisoni]
MAQPPDPYGRNLYEILKIWVPTHGVINVYRKPAFSCGEYHVDNGWLYEEPSSNGYGIETLRILASHGSVIIVKRNDTVEGHVWNKYTITPPMAMDASAVNVEGWTE